MIEMKVQDVNVRLSMSPHIILSKWDGAEYGGVRVELSPWDWEEEGIHPHLQHLVCTKEYLGDVHIAEDIDIRLRELLVQLIPSQDKSNVWLENLVAYLDQAKTFRYRGNHPNRKVG